MQKIAGQKPVVTKARKAIAGFKIREGYPIGCMVTLRQERMYEFLDRLVSHRAAARARLPRRVGQGVRRPRQLQHGRQGTDHLPGDRVRQDRRDPRDEHHDHDDREDRRRSQGAARRVQISRSGTEGRHGQTGSDQPQREAQEAGRRSSPRSAPRCEAIIDNQKVSDEDRFAARLKLQALPRNANKTRLRNRCALTGRPRGVLQQVRPRPQQAARVRDARRDPRHRQGQLVTCTQVQVVKHEHD